ncbi:hypothetical protein C0992_012018 [Termitomyces sp. T32_za158]|nr:hypothetical protein C0992_012018 [Termitomyces sp. T32_za158]
MYNGFTPPSQTITVANATRADLVSARNSAYQEVVNAYNQQKTQIELLNAEVAHLRQLTTTLASSKSNPIMSAPIRSNSRINQTHSLQVPQGQLPKTEDRENYPNVPFWEKEQWQAQVEREKNRGERLDRFAFITDSDGKPISKKRCKEIADTSRSCWNELRQHKRAPSSWKKKTNEAKDYYYYYMLTRYPEFLFADNYWKVECYATIKYPNWVQNRQEEDEITSGKRSYEDRDNLSNERKQKRQKRLSSPPCGVPVYEVEDNGIGVKGSGLIESSGMRLPYLQRPKPRRALNPLKYIIIPPLMTSIPEAAPPANTPTMKKINSKQLKAKDGVITARNLYLIDYLISHSEATEGEFAAVWKTCDAATREKYQQLSKEQMKARKKAIQATDVTPTSSNMPNENSVNF